MMKEKMEDEANYKHREHKYKIALATEEALFGPQ